MRHRRRTFLLACLALLSAFVGLAALASGGSTPAGTGSAGERQTFYAAAVVALLSGLGLLASVSETPDERGGSAQPLAAAVAALALSLPAVWAFGYPVTTADDDVSGCGSISSPVKLFDSPAGETRPTPTCVDRLRRQKLLAAGLVAPSLLIVSVALAAGLRRPAAFR